MSLINDVLRDIDRRQATHPPLATGETPLMVAPEARSRRWPPSWMLLLIVGLALGAIGGHLLYNQFSPGSPDVNLAGEPLADKTTATPEPIVPAPPVATEPPLAAPGDRHAQDATHAPMTPKEEEAETPELVGEPDEPARVISTAPPPAVETQPEATPLATPTAAQPANTTHSAQAVFLPPGTRVNLRAGPSLDAAVQHVLSDRSQLMLIEDGEQFRQVSTADGTIGWVSARYSSLTPYPVAATVTAPTVTAPQEAVVSTGARAAPTPSAPSQDSYRNALRALERGDTEAAEAGLRQAMAARPDDPAPLDALVALMLRQNRQVELQTLLMDLHANGLGHATHLLARLQVEAGDSAGAIALLSSLPAEQLGGSGLVTLAALHQRAGNHRKAADTFRQALSLGNRSASTWAGLAISLEALGERENAKQAWESVLASGAANASLADHARRRLAALVSTGD